MTRQTASDRGPGAPSRRRGRRATASRSPTRVYGSRAGPPCVLMPPGRSCTSRIWKAQVRYLARHYRVVTFDGRGQRRVGPTRWGRRRTPTAEYAADTVAVHRRHRHRAGRARRPLERGHLGRCRWPPSTPSGCRGWSRSSACACVAAAGPGRARDLHRRRRSAPRRGWAKYNRHYWLEGGYDDFVAVLLRPDVQRAALDQADRGRRRLGARDRPRRPWSTAPPGGSARRGRVHRHWGRCCAPCPVPGARRPRHARTGLRARRRSGVRLAELPGGSLVVLDGAGHGPPSRDPVVVNREPRPVRRAGGGRTRHPERPAALDAGAARGRSGRCTSRRRSASGHARRDVAIADELRSRPPRPAGRLARPAPGDRGARGRAASGSTRRPAWLANESAHVEDEAGEHDLHAFQAIRRMDEILVNNFMVFDDVVERRALRPRDRRRGVGRRLLPAREPRAQALRVRLDDRLRRLAADAGRRRRTRRR